MAAEQIWSQTATGLATLLLASATWSQVSEYIQRKAVDEVLQQQVYQAVELSIDYLKEGIDVAIPRVMELVRAMQANSQATLAETLKQGVLQSSVTHRGIQDTLHAVLQGHDHLNVTGVNLTPPVFINETRHVLTPWLMMDEDWKAPYTVNQTFPVENEPLYARASIGAIWNAELLRTAHVPLDQYSLFMRGVMGGLSAEQREWTFYQLVLLRCYNCINRDQLDGVIQDVAALPGMVAGTMMVGSHVSLLVAKTGAGIQTMRSQSALRTISTIAVDVGSGVADAVSHPIAWFNRARETVATMSVPSAALQAYLDAYARSLALPLEESISEMEARLNTFYHTEPRVRMLLHRQYKELAAFKAAQPKGWKASWPLSLIADPIQDFQIQQDFLQTQLEYAVIQAIEEVVQTGTVPILVHGNATDLHRSSWAWTYRKALLPGKHKLNTWEWKWQLSCIGVKLGASLLRVRDASSALFVLLALLKDVATLNVDVLAKGDIESVGKFFIVEATMVSFALCVVRLLVWPVQKTTRALYIQWRKRYPARLISEGEARRHLLSTEGMGWTHSLHMALLSGKAGATLQTVYSILPGLKSVTARGWDTTEQPMSTVQLTLAPPASSEEHHLHTGILPTLDEGKWHTGIVTAWANANFVGSAMERFLLRRSKKQAPARTGSLLLAYLAMAIAVDS